MSSQSPSSAHKRPCPCGSGHAYARCHGRAAGEISGLLNARRADEAYRQACAWLESYQDPQVALLAAAAAAAAGRMDVAEPRYRELLDAHGPTPAIASGLAQVLVARERWAEAVDLFEAAAHTDALPPGVQYHYAAALQASGRRRRAYAELQGVMAARLPQLAGDARRLRLHAAIELYELALRRKPDYQKAPAHNLASALPEQRQLERALRAVERAIDLERLPARERRYYADTHYNLGNALCEQAEIERALWHYERATALNPAHPRAASNRLLTGHYAPARSPDEIADWHRAWGQAVEAAISPWPAPRAEPLDGRRLRIGYVSSDFRKHAVSHFIGPVIEHHDRDRVAVYAYYNGARHDDVTQRLQGLSDAWRDVVELDDDALCRRIRADAIDVLVDLNGHTGGNRLLAFARRPAPVQMTWIGYPDTTGLSRIDYRIVDAITDPPQRAERWHTESLLRLSQTFSAFAPPEPCPPPGEREGETVVFGSFNHFAKMNRRILALWARILASVPQSRLVIKNFVVPHAGVARKVHRLFGRFGVAPERVELHGLDPSQHVHLQRYQGIDIGLDPFPYNGTTTTCDTLWMGVPVVTLCGASHVSRVGASQLRAVGLDELVAGDEDEYVAIAAGLANDPKRLRGLQRGLRERVAGSPLTDAAALTRELEAEMARIVCERLAGGPA